MNVLNSFKELFSDSNNHSLITESLLKNLSVTGKPQKVIKTHICNILASIESLTSLLSSDSDSSVINYRPEHRQSGSTSSLLALTTKNLCPTNILKFSKCTHKLIFRSSPYPLPRECNCIYMRVEQQRPLCPEPRRFRLSINKI